MAGGLSQGQADVPQLGVSNSHLVHTVSTHTKSLRTAAVSQLSRVFVERVVSLSNAIISFEIIQQLMWVQSEFNERIAPKVSGFIRVQLSD